MSLARWLTLDGIELAEIIGCTDAHGESRQTVMVTCTKTCATEFVDPPTWLEQRLGVTFAAKLLRAIDKVRSRRSVKLFGHDDRRSVCAGVAAILGAEQVQP